MVDVNARQALQDEIDFLGEVKILAEGYHSKVENPLSQAIFESWTSGLTRHETSNQSLIDASDPDFHTLVEEEMALMGAFIVAANSRTPIVRDAWHGSLTEDMDLLIALRGAA